MSNWLVQVQKMDGEILFATSFSSLEDVFEHMVDIVDRINSHYRLRDVCCRAVVRRFDDETYRLAYEHCFVVCLYPTTCARG